MSRHNLAAELACVECGTLDEDLDVDGQCFECAEVLMCEDGDLVCYDCLRTLGPGVDFCRDCEGLPW